MNNQKKKNKWLWIGLSIALVLVLTFVGITVYQKAFYEKTNNITKKVEKNPMSYLDKNKEDYLVYFYNETSCDDCKTYTKELKKYEKGEKSLSVYKVNVDELDKKVVEDQLFMDKKYPYVVLIKGGHEDYRYVGAYPIKELPTK